MYMSQTLPKLVMVCSQYMQFSGRPLSLLEFYKTDGILYHLHAKAAYEPKLTRFSKSSYDTINIWLIQTTDCLKLSFHFKLLLQ
jgi:hypothetical protein